MAQTARAALPDICQRGTDLLKGDSKSSFHVSTEHVSKQMTQNGSPDNLSRRSMEQWPQLLLFIDSPAGRASSSSRLD